MTLTSSDIADLERIESEIDQDQNSFLRLARNIREIKERKLYLREYKTFEAYCQNRWGWTRQWINQQLRSDEAISQLPKKTVETMVSKTVSGLTERTAREVAGLAPESRMEVLEHAVAKEEPLTSATIKESAKVVAKAKNGAPEKQAEPPKRRDHVGWPIPPSLFPVFDRTEHIERMLAKIAEVRGWVRRMQESPDAIFFAEFSANQLLISLDNVYAELKRAVPFAVCPICQGIKPATCLRCKKRGVISRFMWDTSVPEEEKEIRRRTLEDERK